MTIYRVLQILNLLGLPTIIGLLIKFRQDQIHERAAAKRDHEAELKNMRDGLQAILQLQLEAFYEHYKRQRYAPLHVKHKFEVCYSKYHNLGANGVMDDVHDEFMDLPTEPPAPSPVPFRYGDESIPAPLVPGASSAEPVYPINYGPTPDTIPLNRPPYKKDNANGGMI